jgi:hypothetical protein
MHELLIDSMVLELPYSLTCKMFRMKYISIKMNDLMFCYLPKRNPISHMHHGEEKVSLTSSHHAAHPYLSLEFPFPATLSIWQSNQMCYTVTCSSWYDMVASGLVFIVA